MSTQHSDQTGSSPASHAAPCRIFTGEFLAVLLVQFAFGVTFSSYYLLPNYLLSHRHDAPWVLGAAQGAFALAGVVTIPLIGKLLDTWGRVTTQRAAIAVGTVAYALFAYADTHASIIGLRFVQGIAFSAVFNAGATLTVDMTPEGRRAEALGYFASAMMITNAIGPALGEQIAFSYGWRWSFTAVALWGVLALVASLFVRERVTAVTDTTRRASAARVQFSLPLTATIAGGFGLGVGVGAFKNFVPALSLLLGGERTAWIFVAFTIGALTLRTLFGTLPDRLGAERASVIALYAYGAALLMASCMWDTTSLLVVSVAIGVAHGLAYPALSAAVVAGVPAAARGRATTYLTGGFNLGLALGTAGLTPLAPWLGFNGLLVAAASAVTGVAVFGHRVEAQRRRTLLSAVH